MPWDSFETAGHFGPLISSSAPVPAPYVPRAYTAHPSASYTLTNALADVTGFSVSVDVPRADALVFAWLVCSITQTDTAGSVTPRLNIDGTDESDTALFRVATSATDDAGGAASQIYFRNDLSAGVHTFKVRAVASGATPGNATINATGSNLIVLIF